MLAILDRAAQLKLNAVIFQVRPACDALYASQFEPWSEYLTGTMGKARAILRPAGVRHRRGTPAWTGVACLVQSVSRAPSQTWSAISADHISKTKPQLVRKYGQQLWLDPGEKKCRLIR